MEFFDNMQQHLKNTQNPNSDIRKQAESEIRNLRDTDPIKFMATLTKEIADESVEVGSRQMALIIFKNFIMNRSKDQKYENYWIQQDPQFRHLIKEGIIAQLASPIALVRAQVANVVSTIACIEIPRHEWDDLLPLLCANSEHEDYNIRMSSLTTLGYICEEIDPESVIDPIKNQIIVALIKNIDIDPQPEKLELCKVACKALSLSIPFSTQNFKMVEERNYIMQKIFEGCRCPDEDIIESCLTCLREISTQEYDSIQFYFEEICKQTSSASTNQADKVGAQAFEFWTTLIDDETERRAKNVQCYNYVASCSQDLIKMILQGLTIINFEEDEDEDDWGHSVSAGCCLQALAGLIRSEVMKPVIDFVAPNLQIDNWKNKYAALIALGSICNGPEKDQFLMVIREAMPSLLAMFQDKSPKVRESAMWVLSRICEFHSDVVSSPQAANQIIPWVKQSIQDSPRISNQACSALKNLAVACSPQNEERQNCLTPYFQEILQLLLMNSKRNDFMAIGVDLMQASYTAMTDMVENACSDSHSIIFELLTPVCQQLQETIGQGESVKNFQDHLCGLLQVCLYQSGHMVDKNYQDQIVQLIIKIFTQEGRVTENGLIAFHGMVTGVGENIDISQIGSYIKYALESQDDDCARIACGIITDLSSSMGTRLAEYLQDFAPCLQNILRSPTINQKIKLPALHALGDLSLNIGDQFNQHFLPETMTILAAAANMCCTTQTDLPETLEFLMELRQEILEQYGTILVSVGESEISQVKDTFGLHLETICDFLQSFIQIEGFSNQEQLMQVAGLMMDLVRQYQGHQLLKAKLQQPYVEQMLAALNEFPDQEAKETATNTYKAITEI